MLPIEKANSILRNAKYFTKSKQMDFELAYYVVQVAYDYAKKMDDKAYWLEVKWAIDKIKNADN